MTHLFCSNHEHDLQELDPDQWASNGAGQLLRQLLLLGKAALQVRIQGHEQSLLLGACCKAPCRAGFLALMLPVFMGLQTSALRLRSHRPLMQELCACPSLVTLLQAFWMQTRYDQVNLSLVGSIYLHSVIQHPSEVSQPLTLLFVSAYFFCHRVVCDSVRLWLDLIYGVQTRSCAASAATK